jgi:hypothetical protein
MFRGTHTPRCAHSAPLRAKDLICCGQRPKAFICLFLGASYISLGDESF